MAVNEKDVERLLEKVEKVTKEKKLDLSSDEDLSIGIMNLISIEEHLFFTAEKTNNDQYYELLREVREMRKELLKMIITEYEGEVWCISKHLLASSMRLMEVGTKQLGKGDTQAAKRMFEKAYHLYSLFWALNLKMISSKSIKEQKLAPEEKLASETAAAKIAKDDPADAKKRGILSKFGDAVKKAVDCCKE